MPRVLEHRLSFHESKRVVRLIAINFEIHRDPTLVHYCTYYVRSILPLRKYKILRQKMPRRLQWHDMHLEIARPTETGFHTMYTQG